jgi:predicted Zn-dependent protease
MTKSLLDDQPVIYTADVCKALFERIQSMSNGGGYTSVYMYARSSGAARWFRSRLNVSAQREEVYLSIDRNIRGARGRASTTRTDDAGLRDMVRTAEASMMEVTESPENIDEPLRDQPHLKPVVWSDTTVATSAGARAEIARRMMSYAESQKLLVAGELLIGARIQATANSRGLFRHYPISEVQCSTTVRTGIGQGNGSGWAGVNDFNLARVDIDAIARRAVDKCLRSRNPVALEPGRYTAVLEPQAVADLARVIVERSGEPGLENPDFSRPRAEDGHGPFARSRGRSKIGEQVIDRRFTFMADPMDPDAGFVPFDYGGNPYMPVRWIDNGVLRELSYPDGYARRRLGLETSLPNSLSFRLTGDGATTSVEEMIRSTERGILVTRFNSVDKYSSSSLLVNGFTRDGLWLIERGNVTKPIKNFRFTDSPIFMLAKVEAYSAPVRVFSPSFARMAPALKVRDFAFTGLVDAV